MDCSICSDFILFLAASVSMKIGCQFRNLFLMTDQKMEHALCVNKKRASSNRMFAVTFIQRCQKGHRCRKLLRNARLLPCDIWKKICRFLHNRSEGCIAAFVAVRVLRCKYLPNQGDAHQQFSKMTSLVRKYNAVLSAKTRHEAFNLALTVLCTRARGRSSSIIVSANSLVEDMLNRVHTDTFQNAIRDFRSISLKFCGP